MQVEKIKDTIRADAAARVEKTLEAQRAEIDSMDAQLEVANQELSRLQEQKALLEAERARQSSDAAAAAQAQAQAAANASRAQDELAKNQRLYAREQQRARASVAQAEVTRLLALRSERQNVHEAKMAAIPQQAKQYLEQQREIIIAQSQKQLEQMQVLLLQPRSVPFAHRDYFMVRLIHARVMCAGCLQSADGAAEWVSTWCGGC
eukprot:SAG11_NODE_5548_length_1529_cov_1.529371_2_plen_206_part_00